MFCPKCGTKLPQGCIFCPECGTKVTEYTSKLCTQDYSYRLLLITKYEALARKYKTTLEEIVSVLQAVISRLQEASVDAVLLDVSEITEDGENWEEYKKAMVHAIEQQGWAKGPETYVMIIGGDDCVPMPRVSNPKYTKDDPMGLKKLHCDTMYSMDYMPYTYDFTGGNDSLTLYQKYEDVDFVISRLPLPEDADCKNEAFTFEEDMNAYFDKAIPKLSGIEVNRVIMTSAQVWIPASTYMVEGLPSVNISRYLPSSAREGNVVVAPEVSIKNEDVCTKYSNAYQEADMVLFNLHGSDAHSGSAYYGQRGNDYPPVVVPSKIGYTSAGIITSCACFGARFIGYPRYESMLLASLYDSDNNIVLFAGSCSIAYGGSPHAFSETMLKIYTDYLMSGMPAAQAWAKAKLDYLQSTSDDIRGALATFLMFNLYGLPMLHVKTNNQSKYKKSIMEYKQSSVTRTCSEERTTLFKRNPETNSMDILSEVRNAVDANLAAIRQTIEKELYEKLGLSADDLTSIESYVSTDSNGVQQKGYYFNYVQKNDLFTSIVNAQTDEEGNILKTEHTK